MHDQTTSSSDSCSRSCSPLFNFRIWQSCMHPCVPAAPHPCSTRACQQLQHPHAHIVLPVARSAGIHAAQAVSWQEWKHAAVVRLPPVARCTCTGGLLISSCSKRTTCRSRCTPASMPAQLQQQQQPCMGVGPPPANLPGRGSATLHGDGNAAAATLRGVPGQYVHELMVSARTTASGDEHVSRILVELL